MTCIPRHAGQVRLPELRTGTYTGRMAMTVQELAERLNAEAARRGISVDALLDELADKLPQQRRLGFVSLGASTSGRTAREADEMLAEGFGQS